MNGEVRKRQPARRDIVRCDLQIAEARPASADRFLVAVEEAFRGLADHPGLGEPCPFRGPDSVAVRLAVVSGFRNFVIYHQAFDGGIEVLRVVHAARDRPKLRAMTTRLRRRPPHGPRTAEPLSPEFPAS